MIDRLKDKKIAIVGLGKNNQKLADFFKLKGINFEVVDNWKNPDELVGKLDSFDMIFRSPGLPYLSKAIVQAKEAGVEISSQTKLFFENCPCQIIGVTGTKGKGTTSSLITKILEAAGKKVWLAGNIGTDPFEFIDKIQKDDLVVLELSSFQLQDMEVSPHIAVVLSITPDHLNHHENFDEYIKAKSNIVAHQSKNDFAIVHSSLPDWFIKLGDAKKIFMDPGSVKSFNMKLLGEHNFENVAAAFEVAKILEISESITKKAVAEFEPLPHRLQIVAEKNGITFVDDSISTNEESTIAAIRTFKSPVIAIIGGSSKGLDYKNLVDAIKSANNLKAVVVIGEVAPVILNSIQGFTGEILTGAKNMSEIFDQIKTVAKSGDVVLLSPAAASFDMFKDYKDRGDQFIAAANSL
jgi:UDP-N-acetylmuramoylalanine--D-glutamate ligase